jgi:seryl-tRNA synthetase
MDEIKLKLHDFDLAQSLAKQDFLAQLIVDRVRLALQQHEGKLLQAEKDQHTKLALEKKEHEDQIAKYAKQVEQLQLATRRLNEELREKREEFKKSCLALPGVIQENIQLKYELNTKMDHLYSFKYDGDWFHCLADDKIQVEVFAHSTASKVYVPRVTKFEYLDLRKGGKHHRLLPKN